MPRDNTMPTMECVSLALYDSPNSPEKILPAAIPLVIVLDMPARSKAMFDYHSAEQPYAAYVHEGCRKTVFQAIDGKTIPHTFRIARLSMTEDYQAVYEALCKVATDDSILILEGINDNKDTKAFWKRVQESQKATRTYDLFLCGIIVFDTSKHKHHYIVNF